MNKYVKIGLSLGAGYLITRQSIKYMKKSEFAARRMQEISYFKEFNELKQMVEDIIQSFSNQKIDHQYNQQSEKEESVKDTEQKDTQQNETKRDRKEESIAGAVKEVLDTAFVKQLIPDEQDMKVIKDVIDETAQVEKLLRSWFK